MSPKLFIATPAYGNAITTRYVVSALNSQIWLREHGIPHVWQFVADSLITRARSVLVAQMMASPEAYTHLLFIDADLGWNPESIARLLYSGHDVCCGVYPKKTDPGKQKEWTCRFVDHQQIAVCQRTGFVEIKDAPTGFLLISRDAFSRMFAAYPERRCQISEQLTTPAERECSYHLFDSFIADGVLQSEDYGFCRLWCAIGGKIWADPEARFEHVGQHGWSGALKELFV